MKTTLSHRNIGSKMLSKQLSAGYHLMPLTIYSEGMNCFPNTFSFSKKGVWLVKRTMLDLGD